jgi:hypothetical protein
MPRTHNNVDDIVWNIIDILDDYINFDVLNADQPRKQAMLDEMKAYVESLNGNNG